MSALGDNLRPLLGGEALAAAENGAVREISPDIDSKELMVDIKALFAGGNSASKARMKELPQLDDYAHGAGQPAAAARAAVRQGQARAQE